MPLSMPQMNLYLVEVVWMVQSIEQLDHFY